MTPKMLSGKKSAKRKKWWKLKMNAVKNVQPNMALASNSSPRQAQEQNKSMGEEILKKSLVFIAKIVMLTG